MVDAIVDFDYDAQENDELTIRKGDVLRQIEMKPGGWWEGNLNDKRGMFPDNFVHLIDSEVVLRNKSHKRQCRAIFSYNPEHDDELQLNIGDIIDVLEEVEDGWWKGRLGSKEGVFPSNFVEEIKTNTTNHAIDGHKKGNSKWRSSSRENVNNLAGEIDPHAPILPPKPVKTLCQALYAYQACNVDELTLKVGDIITLISKDGQDKGWWRGELRGRIGVFPDNFVEIITIPQAYSNPIDIVPTDPTDIPSTALSSSTTSVDMKKKNEKVISKTTVPAASPMSTTITSTSSSSITGKVTNLNNVNNNTSSNCKKESTPQPRKSSTPPAQNNDKFNPPIPGRKPLFPIKKSPSLTSGNIISSIKQKVLNTANSTSSSSQEAKSSDNLDGIASSRQSLPKDESLENHATETGEKRDEFDRVERSGMLSDLRATRAKAPGRRPPSMIVRDEPGMTNGNSVEHLAASPEETSDEKLECKPKPIEKQRAPWMDELKLNQAKKTSQTSPDSTKRTKFTTSPSLNEHSRLKLSNEKLNEDDGMSKSMSAIRLRTPTPDPLEPGSTSPSVAVKPPGVSLRNRASIQNSPPLRPSSIHGTESRSAERISPGSGVITIRNQTPSPVLKPPTGLSETTVVKSISGGTGDRRSFDSNVPPTNIRHSLELEDRIKNLELLIEKQNQMFNDKLDEVLRKLEREIDLRQQLQSKLDKLEQCVTQV